MAKLRLPRVVLSVPRLLAAIVLVGAVFAGAGYSVLRQPTAEPLQVQTSSAKQGSIASATSSPTVADRMPAVTSPVPAPATAPKPSATTEVAHSSTPAPAVTPSNDASVNSLTPVNPTPTPPAAPDSSSGSDSTTAPPNGDSTPPAQPPQQTTGYTSTNWSGYLAATGHYTGVSGSWTVPAATGVAGKTSADTAWVGIGGVTSNDLIQAGTFDTVSVAGHQTVQAFYELLPRSAHLISTFIVTPGDVMSATITETSTDHWHIAINDITSGAGYSTDVTYASAHTSAEWIEEDPSQAVGGVTALMPLDIFAPVRFTGSTTTTDGSNSTTIAGSQALPVTLVAAHGSNTLALPSALEPDGQSFTVTHN